MEIFLRLFCKIFGHIFKKQCSQNNIYYACQVCEEITHFKIHRGIYIDWENDKLKIGENLETEEI